MPAKKKKATTKKTVKKFSKAKEPVEGKEPQETKESSVPEQSSSDTVIPSPQSSTEPQPEAVSPPPSAPPPLEEPATLPPDPVAAVPPVPQPSVIPSPVAAVPPVQDQSQQIVSTTGQVLPASGPVVQSTPDLSALPQVPVVPPPTEQIPSAPQSPSTFQLDDAETGNKKNIILMILLILIIAALIGIGFVYRNAIMGMFAGKTAAPTPTPSPVSKEVVKPTKKAETVKLDAYSLTVLNGSGTAGEASKVKELLTEKGFKVGTVGNADTSDFEETVIQAKSSIERDFLDSLKKVLSETYSLDPVDSLSETDDSDIVIIIGRNKNEK